MNLFQPATAIYLFAGAFITATPNFVSAQTSQMEASFADKISTGMRSEPTKSIVVPTPQKPQEISESPNFLSEEVRARLDNSFKLDNVRYVVVAQGNKLIYRFKRAGVTDELSPLGFSMSKSMVAITLGHALCRGQIRSLDDKAASYASGIAGTAWGDSSIRDLLKMTSGAYPTSLELAGHKNKEMWRDLGDGVFRGELNKPYETVMRDANDKTFQSGQRFNYNNLDTVALSLVIAGATGKTFIEFFTESTWRAVGAKNAGAWVVNNSGQASAYQGFSATPEDWLRVGSWVLRTLKDPRSCMGRYLSEATQHQISVLMDAPAGSYGYQTWINCTSLADFCFLGHFGQHLLFNKKNNVVMYIHGASTDPSVYRSKRHFSGLVLALEGSKPDQDGDRFSVEWSCAPGVVRPGREGKADAVATKSVAGVWSGRTHVSKRDGSEWAWSMGNPNGSVTSWSIHWSPGEVRLRGSLTHEIRQWAARWDDVVRKTTNEIVDVPVLYTSHNFTRQCRVSVVRH